MEILLIILTITLTTLCYKHFKLTQKLQKLSEYSHELKTLNDKLNRKVSERTKLLEESFQNEVESIYNSALLGKVAGPMLHDIATPLSALRGSILIIKEDCNNEFVTRAEESIEQIIRILEHGRELMRGRKIISEFSPSELINGVAFVLKNNLQRAEIKLESNVDPHIQLSGVPQIFERIIINVLLNSTEELELSNKENKIIELNSRITSRFLIIEVIDNGRGITPELINKIFEANFSSKSENNLGFGLKFVKDSIEKYFYGSISVESVVGKYTKFVLRFRLDKALKLKQKP